MDNHQRQILRSLPAMDELLENSWIFTYVEKIGRETVKKILNELMSEIRQEVIEGDLNEISMSYIRKRAENLLQVRHKKSLKKVVNATGVVVHTNLGRSCLATEAVESVKEVASGYSTLEYNLDEGKRGQRNEHIEWLLCQVTGAEAALVVNNNAGAVILCLAALARDREVVVSRGELVEIGGSFRVPEIMAFSGAKLVEVGSTNRTHLRDYVGAVTDNTAMFLKVHPSNFKIEGFSSVVPREDLAGYAHNNGLVFMEDLGSGILVDVNLLGLAGEPTVSECIRSGVDVVTFSGDKMLGGPQIGAIVGKKAIIDKLRTFPLLRALRVDKMTLGAFETTLRLYLKGQWVKIPTLSMLSLTMEQMKKHASSLARRLRKVIPGAEIGVIHVEDAVGGGAFPATVLPGYGVAVRNHPCGSSGRIQSCLRSGDIPVITGAGDDSVVIHVRTLIGGDDQLIVNAFSSLICKGDE